MYIKIKNVIVNQEKLWKIELQNNLLVFIKDVDRNKSPHYICESFCMSENDKKYYKKMLDKIYEKIGKENIDIEELLNNIKLEV
jgi:hypothetical protein